MTAPDWAELVTTALLGTDRRPLPHELLEVHGAGPGGPDPAEVLLSAAARHRAVARAAAPLQRCAAAPVAPPPDRPDAPEAAQDMLGRLLATPVAELVNAWLATAQLRGVRAGPEHWSDLAALATSRPDYDRRLLAHALGTQGSWFLDQNPDWERLAETVRRELQPVARSSGPAAGPADHSAAAGATPDPRVPGPVDLRSRPEAALEVPGPWPRALSVGALQVLLSGQLGWRASRYGAAVGARMAAADADLLQQAADALPELVAAGPGLRLARDALAAVEQSVRLRAEIGLAFDPPDATGTATSTPTQAQEGSDDRA